jgi:hypothetical protein
MLRANSLSRITVKRTTDSIERCMDIVLAETPAGDHPIASHIRIAKVVLNLALAVKLKRLLPMIQHLSKVFKDSDKRIVKGRDSGTILSRIAHDYSPI